MTLIADNVVSTVLLHQTEKLSLSLLGAPSASHAGQPIKFARRQTRALLYRLGASLQPLSRDVLSAMFWPELEDTVARRNMARLLNQLRSELQRPDLVDVTPDVVRLRPDITWSDTNTMMVLCQQDSPSAFAEAVELYRGPFLAGFMLDNNAEFDSWQLLTQEQLKVTCLDALARLIEYYTQVDEPQLAIRFARRYLDLDNLAEGVHRRLILLYAMIGERGMAARQFVHCCAILRQELGVEPMPATRHAYEAALGDGAPPRTEVLGPHESSSRRFPGRIGIPLVGREHAWQQISEAYGEQHAGGFVVISGAPGSGKTRLLHEFAGEVDALVIDGCSHLGTRSQPFYPIVAALRQAIEVPTFGVGVVPPLLAETARLLPELITLFPNLPDAGSAEPRHGISLLQEGLVQILRKLSMQQQVVVCLDDLQWADESTLAWLQYAVVRLRTSAVCFIATYCLDEGESLRTLRRALERSKQLAEIELEPLSAQAIGELIAAVDASQPQDDSLATRIQRATGGNVFLALELIRELSAGRNLACMPEPAPLPKAAQEFLARRLQKLGESARKVLDAACVLAPDLDLELLASCTGLSADETTDAVEDLLQRRLLSAVGVKLAFENTLIEQAAYVSMNHWRAQLLHKKAAAALVMRQHSGRSTDHHRAARHYEAAGEQQAALEQYLLAARAAEQLYAYGSALQVARQAIHQITSETACEVIAAVYEVLGDCAFGAGRYSESYEAYLQASNKASRHDFLRLTSLGHKTGRSLVFLARYAEAAEQLQQALDKVEFARACWEPAVWHVVLDIRIDQGALAYWRSDPNEMELILAEITPQIEVQGLVRHRRKLPELWHRCERLRSRFRLSQGAELYPQQVLQSAVLSELPRDVASARFEYGFVLLWLGVLDQAREQLEMSLELATHFEMPLVQLQALTYLGVLHRLAGRWREVQIVNLQAARLAEVVGFPRYQGAVKAQQAWLLYCAGERAQAKEFAQEALEIWCIGGYPFQWLAHWVLLALCAAEGDLNGAVGAAAAMLDEKQQLLADDIVNGLEAVVSRFWTGDSEPIHECLHNVLDLADRFGYL